MAKRATKQPIEPVFTEQDFKVTRRKLSDFMPAVINPNKGNAQSVPLIMESIQQNGAGRPMLATADDQMAAGSHALQAFKDAGYEDVIVVEGDGKTPVIFKRTDITIDSPEGRSIQIGDNIIGMKSFVQDHEVTAQVLKQLAAQDPKYVMAAGFTDLDVKNLIETIEEAQKNHLYSRNVEPPLYEPSEQKPALTQLYEMTKTKRLIDEIHASNLSEDEKTFLMVAAQRHTIIDYAKVADYYAHASPDMQRLMEQSALVILDYDRAVELGYIQISDELAALYEQDYGNDDQ